MLNQKLQHATTEVLDDNGSQINIPPSEPGQQIKLQPNLDTVWDFHGWNLAYNISVQVKTPPERWQWVQRGIERSATR